MSIETRPKKRILFVDDEQKVLEGLRRALRHKRREWEMVFASGVSEALDLLGRDGFDALVSDINMPKKDGFELLRMIRENEEWRDIPVVILTGNGQSEMKRRALDMGATDLLGKPVEAEDLVARLNSVLRLKAYQDEIKAHNTQLEQKVRERTAELEFAQAELIWRLGKAGEFRDSDTGYHVVRVGFYSRLIAEGLGMEAEYLRAIFLTSPLHDLGKIGIPDNILLKPGKLTPVEWVTMKEHTLIGAQILREETIAREHVTRLGILVSGPDMLEGNPLREMAARIAESHHERWDGVGYPEGRRGEEIPLAARITQVADVYDALCSRRPYKEAFPEKEVLAIMREGAGSQFDPEIFNVFEQLRDAFRDVRIEFQDESLERGDAA